MLTRGSLDHHLWLWHRRLGNPSLAYLKHLFPSFRHTNMSLDCETRVLAKSHKHSYLPSFSHSTSPFSLIHSDVWGPATVFATHHYSYYVFFVDDYTRMSLVYFLKHKSETFSVFVVFYHMLQTQYHANHKFYDLIMGGSFLTHLCNNLCMKM